MLLYLTSAENVGLFDFLTEELGMLVKKLSGEFSLNKFVVHDMRNLSHFSYIAIDLEAIKDNLDETIESLIAFKALYDSRIIIFAERAQMDLLNRIIEETEIYNIITAKDIKKIKEEIKISISPQGMTKDYLLKSMNSSMDIEIESSPQYSFIGGNIKIVIAGAMNRVGTTTKALNMASYLARIGAKVSYTEANENNHLEKIHSYFFPNIPINNNCFSREGVDYFLYSNLPGDNYNFNIIDIGIINQRNKKIFGIGEVKVLCSGIKPYEIPQLNSSLNMLENKDIFIILNDEETQRIKKSLPIDDDKIHSSKYASDLFNTDINNEIWRSILSDYVVEHRSL